ncbi:hypothetical protein Fmac_011028 [Flemingia macrophylla]|uniref:Uncharacterized protein n=1 Tax=Flemingia macrophylla TaxID=520843 RepID=A0ABD1MLA1_9FABA
MSCSFFHSESLLFVASKLSSLVHVFDAKCGDSSSINFDVFANGSYVHIIKLGDARVRDSISSLQVNYDTSIEDVVFPPSRRMVATTDENSVKL